MSCACDAPVSVVKTTRVGKGETIRSVRCTMCSASWKTRELEIKATYRQATNDPHMGHMQSTGGSPVGRGQAANVSKGVGGSVSGDQDRQRIIGDLDPKEDPKPDLAIAPAPAILRATPMPPDEQPKKSAAGPAYSAAFEKFWEFYPSDRREKKGLAWRFWKAQGGDSLLLPCMRALAWQKPAWKANEDGKFTPGPAPYLNARRFEDAKPSGQSSAAPSAPAPGRSLADLPIADQEKIFQDRKVNGYQDDAYYFKLLGIRS
jgi:hypothetical protein